ncbi:MAG: sensor histidine kinase [Elusimicrobia bacterium]|nr:sensor histidine kinase [Elusimicrobiota bacterium]
MDAPTKEALARLERLSAVGRAAGSFAHDVRGPLHVISSTAELALSHMEPTGELRDGLETILRNARQAAQAAQALLDFAAAPATGFGPCDLSRLLERQLRLLDKMLVSHGVRLLQVRVEASATEAKATISDSGAGMDGDTLAKAGTAFFTSKPNGTGLGLYLTRRLLEDSGGALELASAPGHGTTAVVRLPL